MADNSRSAELTFRKEDLARALARLRSLAETATAKLTELRAQKRAADASLTELRESLEAERKNSSQYERLLSSSKEELREASFKLESLAKKQEANKSDSDQQQQLIESLRAEIDQYESRASQAEQGSRSHEDALGELRMEVASLNSRMKLVSDERDRFKTALYEQEREANQWSLKLTDTEKQEAESLIGDLLSRVNDLEDRLLHSTNGKTK